MPPAGAAPDHVDVYSTPSFAAPKIGQLDPTRPVSPLRRAGDWWEVAVPDGVVVWVYGAFVDVTGDKGRITRGNVRARPRPDTGPESVPVGKFELDDRVDIIATRGQWKQVRVRDRFTAWVPKSMLGGGPPASATEPVNGDSRVANNAPPNAAPVESPPAERVTEGEYRITSGDTISVTVFAEPELSLRDIRVPTNGVIAYPLLGRITVGGHTERSLEQRLTNLLLQGYLREPKVSVSITGYRPFFVSGDVENPGQHTYAEGMTLEKALTLAGGPLNVDDTTNVTLVREGAKPMEVDNLAHMVFPGDVISVKRKIRETKETKTYIYLYGEVNTPGSYEYRQGLTVEQAVALAGGFSDRASKRKIQISRYRAGQDPERLKRVNLSLDIEPGDVITVGASLF